jgi:PAS domain S-box-containing protein
MTESGGMGLQYSPVALPLLLVAVLGVVAAYVGSRTSDRPGIRWYAGTMGSFAAWALFVGLVVVSRSLEWKLLFFAPFLASTVSLCVCWFMFAAEYTGAADRLPDWLPNALVVAPLLSGVLMLTNGMQGLVLVDPRIQMAGSNTRLVYEWGPVVWGGVALMYTLLAGASLLLFRKALHSRNVYRKMSVMLGLGTLTMWGGNVATFAGLSPLPHMMLVPLSFLFWGTLILAGFASLAVIRMVPLNRVLSALGSRFGDVLLLARDVVIEEIDSGVIILDADGYIVDINSTARRMLALDERVVGRRAADVIDIESYFEDYEPGTPLAERREQLWVPGVDGHERCYDINVSNVTDEEGNLAGQSVLIYDVTDQKRRERMLQAREEQLREQKGDLERQKQQLEHQNERLDRFAAIVSHDLRNPLNVASGRVELLRSRLDGEHDPDLEDIDSAHERMEDIIDDALELARSGKAITETREVDIGETARRAWANVDTGAATLECDVDVRVQSDPDRLLNVFENLFRNAIEHNDDEVTVRVGSLADGSGFYVEDTGDGIPSDERERVLEQGYTTSDSGTGLGLSIIGDITRAHGWGLSITDSDEGGARFEIECLQNPLDGVSGAT